MSEPPASPVKLGYEAQITDLTRKLEIAREALELAANRLQRHTLDFETNSTGFFESSEWAKDARKTLTRLDTKEN